MTVDQQFELLVNTVTEQGLRDGLTDVNDTLIRDVRLSAEAESSYSIIRKPNDHGISDLNDPSARFPSNGPISPD